MSNSNITELSDSKDCDLHVQQHLHEFPLRMAQIGEGTTIKRALPSRHKRMIGAWCFLDHAGPVEFAAGEGLAVGPHPHIGLQTFTWMIEGSMWHRDSLGVKQLIQPKQVNLMTAGYGITHSENAPDTETKMHSAQLWIALPDSHKDMPPQFDHYPDLPVVEQDQIEFTILVGEFLATQSPVKVHSELLGVDMITRQGGRSRLALNPRFEYGVLVLYGTAKINGHALDDQHIVVLETGLTSIDLQLGEDSRVLLIGGEPFESPILLWWNFVGRTQQELKQAYDQWVNLDESRFGRMDVDQVALIAPEFPEKMRASQ